MKVAEANPYRAVTALAGVGPALAEKLAKLGVHRVIDLLLHLPYRYQDRTQVRALASVRAGDECLVQGQIVDTNIAYGKRRSLRVTIGDDTGYLGLRFFHFSQSQQQGLATGRYVSAFGEVRFAGRELEIAHPEYRATDQPPGAPEPELTPIYPTTKGLSQARLRKLLDALLREAWPSDLNLPYQALALLHQPPADSTPELLAETLQRVALDELTAYYLVMQHRAQLRKSDRAAALPSQQQLGRVLLDNLGFRLTDAQRRVLTEILNDLGQRTPMLRLLQGDVGSGKTVVAAFAAVRAAEHNCQTALLAPTELLAEQHFINFSNWLTPLGINVCLLTGGMSQKEQRVRREAIASGDVLVAVGTHALFQRKVSFRKLALTIVDEQHRFGVHQRMALKDKAQAESAIVDDETLAARTLQPHQLVMTATPIPRTLTMALYADMDVSVIDELPVGRQPIVTTTTPDSRRDSVVERLREVLARGEQAYWVCPLIEESEELEAAAVESTFADLSERLRPQKLGLLHGRLASEEKSRVMAAFKAGTLDLLIATTVIEVGVDVPNATIMVIENPERLGLAQLHQLRGRIGRGAKKSYCVLLYGAQLTEPARVRLNALRQTNDGFELAEQDLKLRGPGDLLGARQTGEQSFRVADLSRHAHLIPEAIERGKTLLQNDPLGAAALLSAWEGDDDGLGSV